MILKVKYNDGNEHEWFIMDNILRIHHKKIEGNINNLISPDRIIENIKINPNWTHVICQVKTSPNIVEEYSILFNTIGYLCNDEGKTLEKLTN